VYPAAGAVFGAWRGFLLCSVLSATGASLCYLLARLVGAQLARQYFPHRIQAFQAGLEKTCFFFNQPIGFFGFFILFLFFIFCFFLYIFAQKREFLGFFSFKNTLRCIQTLNFNHSY
jgi:uncharacterized membrane protein YdjX (TVP38/TMEM64 family)